MHLCRLLPPSLPCAARWTTSAPCTCADCFGRNAQTMKRYRSNSTKATAQMHGYISNPSKHLALLCLKRYQICSFSSANPHGQAWVLDVRARRGGDRPPTTIFFISVIWLYGMFKNRVSGVFPSSGALLYNSCAHWIYFDSQRPVHRR